MNIFKYFTFLIVFISSNLIAQQGNSVKEVNYTFDINLDNYTEGIPYKAKLYFNDSTSMFLYNKISLEGTKGFFKKVGDRTGKVNGVHFFRNFDENGYQFYLNFNTKELTSRQVLMDKYEVVVKENNIEFNWEVTKESKKIGNFLCYKALAKNFRGRNYTAWFTYEIPVSSGPWKFHGLPGLIIEVHDDMDLINITFDSIKDDTDDNFDFEIPTADEVHNLKSYLVESFRLYLSYVENQKAMISTGQMRSVSPLNYTNLEYNEEQVKLLDEYNQIEYSTYEESIKEKD